LGFALLPFLLSIIESQIRFIFKGFKQIQDCFNRFCPLLVFEEVCAKAFVHEKKSVGNV
jgi:hypothetical protein